MVGGRIFSITLLALGLASCQLKTASADEQQNPIRSAGVSAGVDTTRRTAIVIASEKVAPSVVSIRVTLPEQQVMPDCFFCPPQTETPESFGTGFVLRQDGIILTNQHVVADQRQIVVTLPDGTDVDGRLLGEDPLTDIAVIKIGRTGLPAVTTGSSRDLMIGEWAIAVGNPYSFMLGNAEPTVTAGVISAKGRNIVPSADQTGLYLDMIQTDAAINPGNSGGPLTNALGEVVGVNSSIFSRTGGSVGIGFAIPIERATRVAEEIVRNGSVQRAWTGVDVAGPAQMNDWKKTGGVMLTQVFPDGPAAGVGLKAGDVLLSANGQPLRNWLDWEAIKIDLHVGDTVSLSIRSNGVTSTRRLTLGNVPTTLASKVKLMQGLELVTLTASIRVERGVQSPSGVLVYSATPEISRQLGFRSGDVIFGINNVRINSADDITKVFNQARRGQLVRFFIERGGQDLILTVPMP